MSSPLTRHLPDVYDALEVTLAELKFHAARLRAAGQLSLGARGAQAKHTQHLLKTAEEYDRAATTLRLLMAHVAKRAQAASGAPSDPSAISMHGHARAHPSDAIVAPDSSDAAAPHGRDITTEE